IRHTCPMAVAVRPPASKSRMSPHGRIAAGHVLADRESSPPRSGPRYRCQLGQTWHLTTLVRIGPGAQHTKLLSRTFPAAFPAFRRHYVLTSLATGTHGGPPSR